MTCGGAVIAAVSGHVNHEKLAQVRLRQKYSINAKKLATSSSVPTLLLSSRKHAGGEASYCPQPGQKKIQLPLVVLTFRGCTSHNDGACATVGKQFSAVLGVAPASRPVDPLVTSCQATWRTVDTKEFSRFPSCITRERACDALPTFDLLTDEELSGVDRTRGERACIDDGSDAVYGSNCDRCPAVKNRPMYTKKKASVPSRGVNYPSNIWRCPSTSSLTEEASADLSNMSNPSLWRKPRPSEVRNAARDELETMKDRFKADKKRQGTGAKKRFLDSMKTDVAEDIMEKWMRRRALMRSDRFTVAQKRELRKWFDSLDRDGSGEIGAGELSDPLLSTGLARSAHEVNNLVRQVDRDGSGGIGFKEFLAVFQHPGRGDPSVSQLGKHPRQSAVNKIVTLQEVKEAHGSDMESVLTVERRSILMKEILDETAYRGRVMEDVAKRRYQAERDGDRKALRALNVVETRLENRRDKNNLYIQAVSDAADLKKERERLNEAMLAGHRGSRGVDATFRRTRADGILTPQSEVDEVVLERDDDCETRDEHQEQHPPRKQTLTMEISWARTRKRRGAPDSVVPSCILRRRRRKQSKTPT